MARVTHVRTKRPAVEEFTIKLKRWEASDLLSAWDHRYPHAHNADVRRALCAGINGQLYKGGYIDVDVDLDGVFATTTNTVKVS